MCFIVRGSPTEHPSGGDPETGPVNNEKHPPNRSGGETFQNSTVQMESLTTITSKQRRDKMTNKGQQDEEEERGNYNSYLNKM